MARLVVPIVVITLLILALMVLNSEQPVQSTADVTSAESVEQPQASPSATTASAASSLFAEDLHSQRLAEQLLERGESAELLEKLSQLEVVLNEEVFECYGHKTELKRFMCDWNTEATGHEYYHYDIDALKNLAHGDGVAAFVYADRLMDTDLATAALYFLRSTLLTEKLGPLLRSRSIVFTTYYVNHRDDYQAGVDAHDAGLVAALALDNIAMDMGLPNDLYPLIDISETAVPDSFHEAVLQKQQFFEETLNSIKSEIGIAK